MQKTLYRIQAKFNNFIKVEAINKNPIIEQPQIISEDFHNLAGQIKIRVKSVSNLLLVKKLKKDLGRILSKNSLKNFLKLMKKLAKSITKTNNKVRKSKTYNKAINNSIN